MRANEFDFPPSCGTKLWSSSAATPSTQGHELSLAARDSGFPHSWFIFRRQLLPSYPQWYRVVNCLNTISIARKLCVQAGPQPDVARMRSTASPDQVCPICDVVIYGHFSTCRACNRQIHERCLDDYINVQQGYRHPAPCPACECEQGYDDGFIYDNYVSTFDRNQRVREQQRRELSQHLDPVQRQDRAESPTTREAREQQRRLRRRWEASRKRANSMQQDHISTGGGHEGLRQHNQDHLTQTPLQAQRVRPQEPMSQRYLGRQGALQGRQVVGRQNIAIHQVSFQS